MESRYEIQNEVPTIEEEVITTELSDVELDVIYKRYKLSQTKNTDVMKNMEEEAYELAQKYTAGKAQVGDKMIKTPEELQNQLGLIFRQKM
jgi:hypothetical protein